MNMNEERLFKIKNKNNDRTLRRVFLFISNPDIFNKECFYYSFKWFYWNAERYLAKQKKRY